MNPEEWQKLSTALDQLLDLTEVEQAQFLHKLRTEDPQLCQEVESLLGEQHPTKRLEAPPLGLLEAIPPTDPGEGTSLSAGTGGSGILPRQAGRYVVQQEIARGGMGAILRVADPDFLRILAVKVLLPHVRANPEAEKRFLQEAQITGRLQHPGIPPIHELGRLDDGSPFFAMKLIEGQTLTSLIMDTSLVPGDSRGVGIFEQICRTLAYAHSQGIIHRDLKPSNVMVGAFGEVQVMDWGLAKSVSGHAIEIPVRTSSVADDGRFSRAGDVIGTPAYLAPEQARGEIDRLDERCDVFGLGGILCAMLTRRPPFAGTTADMIHKSAHGDLAETFNQLNGCGADGELIQIAKKCLAAKSDARYRNAGEVADAVTRHREEVLEKLRQAELAREKAQVQAREERRRRRVTLTLAAALLLLVLGVAGALLWYQQYHAQRQARAQHLNDLVNRSLNDAAAERQALRERLTDPVKVRPLLSDPRQWQISLDRARAALKQAEKLADSEPELLEPEQQERLQSTTKQLQADEDDLKFAAILHDVRLEALRPLKGKYDRYRPAGKYAAAFAEKGWDVSQSNPTDIAARIHRSPVHFAAVEALDDWATLTRGDLARRLLEIARRADPDPWRDEIRQLPVEPNPDRLEKLAQSMDFSKQPPQLLRILARRIGDAGGDGALVASKALQHYPGDYWLNLEAGLLSLSAYDRVAYFRAALAAQPDSGVAHGRVGYALAGVKDFEGAIAHCRKSIVIVPKDAEVRSLFGYVLLAKEDTDGAIKHFQEAIRLDPDWAEVHHALGTALQKKGDLPAAKIALQRYQELLRAQAGVEALTAAEAPQPVDLAALRQGIQGRLAKDLPLDTELFGKGGFRRAYGVHLEAGKTYLIDLAGNFDTLLRVEDSISQPLLANDDVSPPTNRNSRLVFSPPKAGIYHLIATSYEASIVGTFRLQIRDLVEVEKTLTAAGNLVETKDLRKGRFLSRHTVRMTAGRAYVIDLHSQAFDTYLLLKDVVENGGINPGNSRHARIDFTPKKTADYLIAVTSAKPAQTGPYTLTVRGYDFHELTKSP